MDTNTALSLITALATVGSVVYIARQVSDSRKQAFGQFLFELDRQFREYQDLHVMLMKEGDFGPNGDELIRIHQYAGLFERCKILIDHRTISIEVFDALYGYRLYRLMRNQTVRHKIANDAASYRFFIDLCHDMVDFKKRKSQDQSDHEFEAYVGDLPPRKPFDWRRS